MLYLVYHVSASNVDDGTNGALDETTVLLCVWRWLKYCIITSLIAFSYTSVLVHCKALTEQNRGYTEEGWTLKL